MSKRALLAVFTAIFVYCSPSFAVDCKIDSDTRSDLYFIKIQSNNKLNWKYYSSSSAFLESAEIGEFGKNGTHLIPGYWTTSDLAEIGVVALSNGKINWRIKDFNGVNQNVFFGAKNDILVSGGDYNGNGFSDAAKISKDGQAQVYADMFAGGSLINLKFQKKHVKNGKALFFSHDGAVDQLSLVFNKKKKNKKKKYTTSLISLGLDGTSKTISLKKNKKAVIDALPLAAPNGVDNLVLIVKAGKKRDVVVYDLSGKRLHSFKVASDSTILVGDYLSDPGEEIGVYRVGSLYIYNPLSNTSSQLPPFPSGVVADQVNVNSFSGGGGSSGEPVPGDLGSVCPKGIKKVSGGFLWKPESDVGDMRKGKPVVLFTGSKKPGKSIVEIYAKNGKKVCSAALKPPSPGHQGVNCNADHFYIGWPGGCHKTGKQIASAAKSSSGNSHVYVQGKGGICIGPIDPDERNDGGIC